MRSIKDLLSTKSTVYRRSENLLTLICTKRLDVSSSLLRNETQLRHPADDSYSNEQHSNENFQSPADGIVNDTNCSLGQELVGKNDHACVTMRIGTVVSSEEETPSSIHRNVNTVMESVVLPSDTNNNYSKSENIPRELVTNRVQSVFVTTLASAYPLLQSALENTSESGFYSNSCSSTDQINSDALKRKGIRTYPALAVISLFFCNPLCGFAAAILTLKAENSYYLENFLVAAEHSDAAKKCLILTIGTGCLLYLTIIVWLSYACMKTASCPIS